jgi:two-component system, NtrC family, response regulator HydG
VAAPEIVNGQIGSGVGVVTDETVDFPRETLRSTAFQAAFDRLVHYAKFDGVTVLLEGESGTGKTFFARHLHALSRRNRAPMVAVNLAELDDALVSSDLFGHVAGSFTGASRNRLGLAGSASGGTLFLDEIGKASPVVQRRLLGLLERRAVRPVGADRELPLDVRLVAATNVSLGELVRRDAFLEDLVPRLGLFRVKIPALRDRRPDIPGLIELLIRKHYAKFEHRSPPVFDTRLLQAMEAAPWPGNLRELDSAVQLLLACARGAGLITLAHCDDNLQSLIDIDRARSSRPTSSEDLRAFVRELGSISEAARSLRLARSTVQRQLRKSSAPASSRVQLDTQDEV